MSNMPQLPAGEAEKMADAMASLPWCASCGKGVSPVSSLSESAQVVQTCPYCESRLGEALTEPLAATGKDIGAEPTRRLPVRRRESAKVVPLHAAAAQPAPVAPAGPTFDASDPIGGITRRLAWLDGEIAKAKGYEAEAQYLRRMLKAGQPRTRTRKRAPKRKD